MSNQRKPFLLLLATSCLAGSAFAQAPTLTTLKTAGIFATDGRQTVLKFIPANSKLTGNSSLLALLGRHAWANLTVREERSGLGFDLTETGNAMQRTATDQPVAGTTQSTTKSSVPMAPHVFLLGVSTTATKPKDLLVTLNGFATGSSRLTLTIDVGNDQRIEWQQALDGSMHSKIFALKGVQGTPVRIELAGLADVKGATFSRYSGSIGLRVRPPGEQPCVPQPFGLSCGPRLVGSDTVPDQKNHIFTTKLTGAFRSGPVVWIFGATLANRTIPGTSCRLNVEPLVFVPRMTDANGADTFVFGSGPLRGRVFLQAIPVLTMPRLQISASNGLYFGCSG